MLWHFQNFLIAFYIMCLYPKLIKNPKYKPNKKNGFKAPEPTDERVLWVPVGCGNCIECRKQIANSWKTRMSYEMMIPEKKTMVTLTFNEEELFKLCEEKHCEESNAIATIAVRRFCERWRKKYKKSIKHWLVTELGHNGTERIHLHGILWTNEEKEIIQKIWKYGQIQVGEWVNMKTINYIIKYITKIDKDHKGYKSIVLCSAGLGSNFKKTQNFENAKFDGIRTKETIRLKNGNEIAMPIYFRNKRYNDDEREILWLQKIDKHERFVLGKRINVGTEAGMKNYEKELKRAQEKNKRCGYGDDTKDWKPKSYNVTNRMLNKRIKLKKLKKGL